MKEEKEETQTKEGDQKKKWQKKNLSFFFKPTPNSNGG